MSDNNCCCSVAKSCPTFLDPVDCSTPGFPVLNYLPEFKPISTESVMSFNHLILCRPLLLPAIFPSIRVFSSESALHVRQPKYWSFNFSISASNEYSGLFPLGLTDLISLLSKGLSRVFSSTIVQMDQLFGTQRSLWCSSHIPT